MSRPRYYIIDHKILFLIGFVFYLIIPCLVGMSDIFHDYVGMDLYQGYFKQIPDSKLNSYIAITLSWLVAFYLGHLSFKLIKPYKKSLELFPATGTTHGISYFAILLVVVLVIFAWLARNSLLGGYSSFDTGARGKMSTLLVIFNFFLLYQLVSRQRVSYLLVAGTIITALLTFSMGGRLYGFQSLIIFLVYKTSFAPKRWKVYQIAVFLIIGFLIGTTAGIWRQGHEFSLDKAAYSFVAEPVFTWLSNGTFLIGNDIPLINFPSNYLTSFFNLVPNTVVGLQSYIVSSKNMGFSFATPLGAESVWSTFIVNFGIIGSFLFIFCTGFLLNFLRHLSENNRFWAVYYIMMCAILPFQFFRDGFNILHKQLFFNILLLPVLILLIFKTIIYLQHANEKPNTGPAH